MKKIFAVLITLLSIFNYSSAQNDTIYFLKNGIIINKQSIAETDIDSAVFYQPYGYGANDIEGNIYATVILGAQEWFAENLKTTKYNDGTDIPLGPDNSSFFGVNHDAYICLDSCDFYGNIYNFFVIDSVANGGRNACPIGWHVPSDEEWKELESFLGMATSDLDLEGTFRGTNEGSMLAGGDSLWYIGNLINDISFGSTDFNALPAKCFGFETPLNGMDKRFTAWWTSSPSSSSNAWIRSLDCNFTNIWRYNSQKIEGAQIRCIKD